MQFAININDVFVLVGVLPHMLSKKLKLLGLDEELNLGYPSGLHIDFDHCWDFTCLKQHCQRGY